MGFMDDLKKLTKPYTEDDDDFDEFDDDARPSRPSRSSSAPKPSYRSSFDLDSDEFSSTGSSASTGRRTLGGNNAAGTQSGKVVNIHATAQLQVVLVKPDRFDSVTEIAEHLRDRRAVLINLEKTDPAISRRLIDFLSGVAYANNGQIKRVATSTFIITPYNVDIMGDLLDELENNGVFF